MKNLFLLISLTLLLCGCKTTKNNNDNVNSITTPYPLTNEVIHIDGTTVEAPKW